MDVNTRHTRKVNRMDDPISRQAAIDALWKAMYEYEDKAKKQFQESEDLDVGDWIEHRVFVQNMNDIDRQTILNLPPAQPEIIRCKDCEHFHYDMPYVIQGLPVIGHEVCDFWGGGCKTAEDGFCSYAERRHENG